MAAVFGVPSACQPEAEALGDDTGLLQTRIFGV